ncbi:MAG: hypothetical protein SOH60_00575 [Lachnospiraceae bacterium]|jgi:hypothetical protein
MKRPSFEVYKSAICHRVKEKGDIDFLIDTLEGNEIRTFFDRGWYPESFYLLAMVDYLSRVNGVSLDNEFDDLRGYKLEKTLYPAGILLIATAEGNDNALKRALKEAIPEFLHFNIVEGNVRDVA